MIMPPDKRLLVLQSPPESLPDQIPAALLDAVFAEDSTGSKLPRAVMVGDDEVVVYQACKAVSLDTLNGLDTLTVRMTEYMEDLTGKAIKKIMLTFSCDEQMRLQALQRDIQVVTKDELIKWRKTTIH